MKTLAERVRWAREKRGYSCAGLDEIADLSCGHVARVARRSERRNGNQDRRCARRASVMDHVRRRRTEDCEGGMSKSRVSAWLDDGQTADDNGFYYCAEHSYEQNEPCPEGHTRRETAPSSGAAQACEVLSPDGGYACTADAGHDGGHWWTDPLGPACDRCGARNTTLKNEGRRA
jgi:hypothetical protein